MVDENEVVGNKFPDNETSRNPFMKVHEKKKYRSGERALTGDQVNKLLLYITDLIHLGLFQLAVSCGARREDLVRIKKADVDFEKQSVTYYESKKKQTKTIFIPVTVANTLKMIVNITKREPYLFPGGSEKIGRHGHLSGRQAWNLFNHYLKLSGLEPRPFHALRATCIKLCQKRGWSIEQAAEHVGDTIAVIQEHYLSPSQEEMKETANTKPIL